jgi:hypothetical protein
MQMVMESSDDAVAKIVASELVKRLGGSLDSMIDAAVAKRYPPRGLTGQELAKVLHMTYGTPAFNDVAYQIPHYTASSQVTTRSNTRWWSSAVDEFMKTYDGGY